MKKATQKTQPVTLGTKRTCPTCGTKFYDFGKESMRCPKCQKEYDADQLTQLSKVPLQLKKQEKVAEKSSDETLLQADELATDDVEIESVDDLADEDEDLVEDLDVDDEEQE